MENCCKAQRGIEGRRIGKGSVPSSPHAPAQHPSPIPEMTLLGPVASSLLLHTGNPSEGRWVTGLPSLRRACCRWEITPLQLWGLRGGGCFRVGLSSPSLWLFPCLVKGVHLNAGIIYIFFFFYVWWTLVGSFAEVLIKNVFISRCLIFVKCLIKNILCKVSMHSLLKYCAWLRENELDDAVIKYWGILIS